MGVIKELFVISIFLSFPTIPMASSPDILNVDIALFMQIA
jgi:hypothetical protein